MQPVHPSAAAALELPSFARLGIQQAGAQARRAGMSLADNPFLRRAHLFAVSPLLRRMNDAWNRGYRGA